MLEGCVQRGIEAMVKELAPLTTTHRLTGLVVPRDCNYPAVIPPTERATRVARYSNEPPPSFCPSIRLNHGKTASPSILERFPVEDWWIKLPRVVTSARAT